MAKRKKGVKKKNARRRVSWRKRFFLGVISVCGIFLGILVVGAILYNGFGPGEVVISTPSGFYSDTIEVELRKTGLFMFQPTKIKYNLKKKRKNKI